SEVILNLLLDYFECPKCNTNSRFKHREVRETKAEVWFGCRNDSCRHHWKMLVMEGVDPKIIAESPRATEPAVRPYMSDAKAAQMGCPRCGRYGRVKMTETRVDYAKIRRHQCPTDGFYYSCTDVDGNVRVTKLRPSMRAVDLTE